MTWTPHVTVAAVVEENGKFLLVEEKIRGRHVLNQPAGHWEANETLVEAVIRETREETGHDFTPQAVLGVYRWDPPQRSISYLRIAFVGQVGPRNMDLPLDRGIIQPLWMTRAEILSHAAVLRSPQVLRCVDDYLAGQHYPLALLVDLWSEQA